MAPRLLIVPEAGKEVQAADRKDLSWRGPTRRGRQVVAWCYVNRPRSAATAQGPGPIASGILRHSDLAGYVSFKRPLLPARWMSFSCYENLSSSVRRSGSAPALGGGLEARPATFEDVKWHVFDEERDLMRSWGMNSVHRCMSPSSPCGTDVLTSDARDSIDLKILAIAGEVCPLQVFSFTYSDQSVNQSVRAEKTEAR
jgi:hypothetical protein